MENDRPRGDLLFGLRSWVGTADGLPRSASNCDDQCVPDVHHEIPNENTGIQKVRRRDFLTAAVAAATVGCEDCSNPNSPTPIPGSSEPTTNGGDVPEDPGMRMETEVDFNQVTGLSGFALALRDESYIHGYINKSLEEGYNAVRILGKTDGWSRKQIGWMQLLQRWLPPGPPMGGGAEQNLKRVLKVAAQYPNLWVEVVACATERDNHEECKLWSRKVANICEGYKNVFINAMNEPQMSNWTNRELNELMKILRKSGRPVGIDQPCEPGHWKFDRELRVDWQGMHPWRNRRENHPTLTKAELRNVIALNGLVLFNETNCYVSDWEADTWNLRNNDLFYLNGNGTEKQRQRAAIQDMEMYRSVRDAKWYFHSIATIMCESLDFWLPKWR